MVKEKVAIVILNYNGWQDTIECLESVYQIDYPNYDVILVDNASSEDSIVKIKEYCDGKIKVESKFFEYNPNNKPIMVAEYEKNELEDCSIDPDFRNLPSNRKLILIKNDRNYGFAGGNNIGVRFAMKYLKPEFILFLNNDTVVDEKFLMSLVGKIKDNSIIGSAQSLLLRKDCETIDYLGQELKMRGLQISDKAMGEKISNYKDIKDAEIFGPCCAAAIYRSEVLNKIGFFDEDFFYIYEDVDLSFRNRLAGFKSYLIVDSMVFHKRGISGGKDKTISMKSYFSLRNYLSILIRYYPSNLIIRNLPKILYIISRLFVSSLYFKKLNETIMFFYKSLRYRYSIEDKLKLRMIIKEWVR